MESIQNRPIPVPPAPQPPPQPGGNTTRVESAATQSLMQLPQGFQPPPPSMRERFKEKVALITNSSLFTYAAYGLLAVAAIGLLVGALWLINQPFTQQLVKCVEEFAKMTIIVLTPGLVVTMLK